MTAHAICIPDPTLDFWAERFIAAELRAVMTFEQYMQLTPALRERRGQLMLSADTSVQLRVERECPNASLHGDALVEPVHNRTGEFRRPWYRNNRKHV